MKLRKRVAVGLLSVLLAFCAGAETIKVFASNLSTISSMSTTLKDDISAMLNDSSRPVDFGYFCGPKALTYFSYTDENYTFDNVMVVQSIGGVHAFAYRTDRYTLLKRYSKVSVGNGGVDAAVVQNKSTGTQYAFIMPTGNQFNISSAGKIDTYLAPVQTLVSTCLTDYPNAKIIVGTTYQWGTTYADLQSYLTGSSYMGYTEFRSDTTGGGIYASPDASLTGSASSVTLTGITEPCSLATLTYAGFVTVTFVDYDETLLGTSEVLQGQNATPPADPVRTGYNFTGWSGSYSNVQESVTLTAQYAIKSYTVAFEDYDGTPLGEPQSVEFGSDATPPPDPVREGYRFLGWQGVYQNVQDDSVVVAPYAEATAETYWVTFNDYDGTELAKQEVIEGMDAVPPSDPVREGYTFVSWQGNYTAVMQNEIVTTQYEIKSFDVTFKDWDESKIVVRSVNWQGDAVPPDNPARTGYTFAEWVGTYTNVVRDEDVIASYTVNSYKVTFMYEDGEVIDEQMVEYQSAATAPADPAPREEGMIFGKWSCDFSEITEDTEVVAEFIDATVDIATPAEFVEKVTASANPKAVLRLVADIDLTDSGYETIPSFSATLDGNGHSLSGMPNGFMLFENLYGTVRNLHIADVGTGATIADNKGLIARKSYGGTLDSCVFENLNFEYKKTNEGGAGLIYSATKSEDGRYTVITNCVMRNCSIRAITAVSQRVGGFVALASYTLITHCRFLVDDPDGISVGGLAGWAGAFVGKCEGNVTITGCLSEGNMTTTAGGANDGGTGGIVGGASGSCFIYDCTNRATITGCHQNGNGGIIGHASKTAVTIGRCVNYGLVSSELFGTANNCYGCGAGGIFGGDWYNTSEITIYDCANFGAVTAGTNAVPAGGILASADGYNGAISVNLTNCMNYADVYSVTNAGGVVGCCLRMRQPVCNVGNCGNVTSETGFAGGIFGSYGFYLNNNAQGFYGVMQSGAVTSGSGAAGLLIGAIEASGSNNSLSLECLMLGGSAETLSGDGVTGAVYAANLSVLPAISHDELSRIVDGSLDDSFTTIEASAFGNGRIVKRLNEYALENGYMNWVQGKSSPELSLFGKAFNSRLVIIIM